LKIKGEISQRPKIAATPATPLHFAFVFQINCFYSSTYAGKSAPGKATGFAATSRYTVIPAF
jgi:hypothetical protein